MSTKAIKELEEKVAELSTQLEDIQEGKYPPPSGGYDVVVRVWARLLRASLPVYSETIKSIDRGSKALVNATWALVLATVVLAVGTIALVFVTSAGNMGHTEGKVLNSIGLMLDFIGVILLFIYAKKTIGATTQADRDYKASPWWAYIGYFLIAVGFLFQFLGNLL